MTQATKASATELKQLQDDEDIQQEAKALAGSFDNVTIGKKAAPRGEYVPLNWKPGVGGHRANAGTKRLFTEAGGVKAMARATRLFYQKAFADPQIDLFIRDHNDPHGERFANWVAEKFGHGQPWSLERRSRKSCPFQSHGHTFHTPHDRSSSHYAAWHSPKRSARDFGNRFKLDDCRVWMRLHFWAMREAGLFEASPEFCNYYVRFLGHFVGIYERKATAFARESARWSEKQSNIDHYLKNGRIMEGVKGAILMRAIKDLPQEEVEDDGWPYEY